MKQSENWQNSMTRECTVDYQKVVTYIEGYNISKNLTVPEYLSSLKLMHKCYFSAITWNAELIHNKERFFKLESKCNEDIASRLSEVVSDLGSSLFNWVNGNYKASRVMLRIAIENFIRAVSAVENKCQLIEKNAYHLFEVAAKQDAITGNSYIKSSYEHLHSDYKILCDDAHTATIQNMEHLSSLADLPSFHKEKSASSSKIYIRVSRNISSIFCILFNLFYHEMHYRNKENILNSLNSLTKPALASPSI